MPTGAQLVRVTVPLRRSKAAWMARWLLRCRVLLESGDPAALSGRRAQLWQVMDHAMGKPPPCHPLLGELGELWCSRQPASANALRTEAGRFRSMESCISTPQVLGSASQAGVDQGCLLDSNHLSIL